MNSNFDVEWVPNFRFFVCIVAVVLSWVAGGQLLGVSKDYVQYETFFDMAREVSSLSDFNTRFEPAFVLLTYVFSRLPLSSSWIYGLFSFLALYIKGRGLLAIDAPAKIVFLFFVFYLSRYFPLYELTQLRVAIALSVAFYVFVRDGGVRIELHNVALLIVAVFFHYSTFILLVVYFFRGVSKIYVLLVFVATFFIAMLGKGVMLETLPGYFRVAQMYASVGYGNTEASYFPKTMVFDVLIVIFAFCFWAEHSCKMRRCVIGLTAGFAIYYGFIDFPVVAFRLMEVTSIFAIIYIVFAMQSHLSVIRYFACLIAGISAPVYIYLYFVHDPLLGF